MKSTFESEYGARFALADGSTETFVLATRQTALSIPAGAYSGEIQDVRERITARTLSGRTVSTLTGARTVESEWTLFGLSPEMESRLGGFLREAERGGEFRLIFPDGRSLAARLDETFPAKFTYSGGGEVRIRFKAVHSPLDPDLILAMNFDGDAAGHLFVPDWTLSRAPVSNAAGVSLDSDVKKYGVSSLKVDSAPLLLAVSDVEAIKEQSFCFFYQPDYSGSPSADRTFIEWNSADGNLLIDFTHLSSGKLRLRIGDGSGNFYVLTTDDVFSAVSGTWEHFAVSFDRENTAAAIYADGIQLDATASGLSAIPYSSTRPQYLVIGAGTPSGAGLATGHYDCLRVMARSLTTDSIPVPADERILA